MVDGSAIRAGNNNIFLIIIIIIIIILVWKGYGKIEAKCICKNY